MEDAPPYSPTAAATERRLPNDYHDHIRQEEEEEMMMRPKTTTNPRHEYQSRTGSLSLVSSPVLEDQHNVLRSIATAPPTFYPPEPPPDYATVDALASSFRLDAPFVYATKTSNTPRYQLMQEFTRSGKPRKLSVRRLLPSETRSASLPSSSLDSPVLRLRYDEDGTMYTITTYEMRGHRSSTLAGSIKLETGMSVLGAKWTKFWLFTKNARRDSLNPENEARLLKYGYHADEEWDKRLLFSVKRGVWEDGERRRVAVENGREFETLGEVSGPRRDLLVSCWLKRVWMGEGIRWEDDVRGCAPARPVDASTLQPPLGRRRV